MFQIDPMSRTPVYEQLVTQIERLVLSGVLPPGSPLPSVRSLSVELAINPNTKQKAYGELNSKGVIQSVPGRGAFVSTDIESFRADSTRLRLTELEKMLKELKTSGVTGQEILLTVDSVYREDKNYD